MNYQSFPPETGLAAFIRCFWTLEADASHAGLKQSVIPDGCMEMIFHLGETYRQYNATGDYFLQPYSFVFGQITSRLEIAPESSTNIFAVRFQPCGFLPFSHLPLVSMENRAVPLDELFGEEGVILANSISNAVNTYERIAIMYSFLNDRLMTDPASQRVVQAAIDLLIRTQGQLSVSAIAQELEVGRRQLERHFSKSVGMGPGRLAKMVRLQAALQMMLDQKFTSLTAVAYEAGYADQAHFIRDFKEFAGVSPRHFYSENLQMSQFFMAVE